MHLLGLLMMPIVVSLYGCTGPETVRVDAAPAAPAPASAITPSPTTIPSGPLNVLGEELAVCSTSPMTGWYRDGSCRTDANDGGIHVVCAAVTEKFLSYSKSRGNDLITPAPRYRFPGLKPGDRWCLCAARWSEAERAGVAPPVVLDASDDKALKIVPLATLERYAK